MRLCSSFSVSIVAILATLFTGRGERDPLPPPLPATQAAKIATVEQKRQSNDYFKPQIKMFTKSLLSW
jgi:hypothetical protein